MTCYRGILLLLAGCLHACSTGGELSKTATVCHQEWLMFDLTHPREASVVIGCLGNVIAITTLTVVITITVMTVTISVTAVTCLSC